MYQIRGLPVLKVISMLIDYYRNTPPKLPWATISNQPGPDGQLTHMGY
jgi:hypothetical protein